MKSHRLRIIGTMAVGLLAVLAVSGVTHAAGTFAPTITFETSTTRATAHPDARITIDNSASDENIKDLSLKLPEGFWGSLAAVDSKCSQDDAEEGACDEESRVGTVTATAEIEDGDTHAKGVLSGGIYLTDAFAGNNDPAGISVVVRAKVGGVDLGNVIVNGRVSAVYGTTPATGPIGAPGQLVGLETRVTDIPQEITDSHGRTVSYKLNEMRLDLVSHLEDSADAEYTPPLLTNPSVCGSYAVTADATPYGGGSSQELSDDYDVTNCDDAQFNPSISNAFSDAIIPAASTEGVISTVSLPETPGQPFESSSFDSVFVRMPPSIGANYPSFGAPGDKCSGASATAMAGSVWFSPANCSATGVSGRPQAKIGELTLETPMLPTPIKGNVYFVNKVPLPWLGVDVNDSIPGNPKGINFAFAGVTGLGQIDPQCDALTNTSGFCQDAVTIQFFGLPDAPASKIVLNLDMGDRTKPGGGTLSGQPLQMGDSDNTCQPEAELLAEFTGHSGGLISRAETHQFSDCPAHTVEPTTGPWGQETDDNTPTFGFNYIGSAGTVWCGVDTLSVNPTDCTGGTSFTSGALTEGAHQMFVGDSADPGDGAGDGLVRGFAVNTEEPRDSTVPTTTLSSVPATFDDTTPSFTFHASESSDFQCSLDGGAFLPCGSAVGTDDESYTLPDEDALDASDETHTFAVRAEDAAGNVDLTPATASFKVEIPFAPTTSIDLTTKVARAHPEMTVTIDNLSHEDIKDYTLAMPDGFFGALTGVQFQCELADVDNGSCGAGSKIGTVTATAVIDRSTVMTSGDVYMTKPRELGDPAGLAIIVKPKLQDVTFDPIAVTARLKVRGQAEGVDALTVDIPQSATSTIGEVSEFDMRKIVLHLEDNPAAPQPLLTNPSGCDAKSFEVSYKGYDDSTENYPIAYQAENCASLGFAPQLSITQKNSDTGGVPGDSSNAKIVNVDFNATLTADPAGAGIKGTSLLLPRPLTIDVGHLPFSCQPDEAAIGACPLSSSIGTATALSPLLGKALTGNVYVLKSNTSLPKLLIALRGDINIDLTASNSFDYTNGDPQIRTTFDTIPDAPISSFSMQINRFLRTWNDACKTPPTAWSIVGSMGAYNGASSAVNIPLSFDCPQAFNPTFSDKFKNSKSKSTYSATVNAQSGKKLKKVTIKLPKGVSFISKAFSKKKIAKYVTVKANGKKLKTKCFKKKGSNKFEIGFCGKKVSTVSISFKKGSLKSKTKKKNLKFSVTVTDSDNKKRTAVDIG